jgi:hypothetical protein
MASKTKVATAATSNESAPVASNPLGNGVAEDNNSQNADDASLVQHEKNAAVPTRFQKIKAHLRKFRWWYLLGLIIFLAILLPIL